MFLGGVRRSGLQGGLVGVLLYLALQYLIGEG